MNCKKTFDVKGPGCLNSVFLVALQGWHLWGGFTN